MLRILHVIIGLEKEAGGPVTVLSGLARAQVKAGHQVVICTTANRTSFVRPATATTGAGVTTSLQEPRKVEFPRWNSTSCFSPVMGRWLQRNIGRFDIVHVHGLYRFPTTYAAWLARSRKIPYIIRPHGALDPYLFKQSRFGRWAMPLKRAYERLLDFPNFNHASAIHYTAQEEMERCTFLQFSAPAVVVANGIDWEHYRHLPERGLFRARLGLAADTPLVLFLGRINFKKGLDLLIPAFARVTARFSNARLAVVGPDTDNYASKVRQWCREQGVSDQVTFVPLLDPEEVKQAYCDADVFVLSSYTENFGMTVVEAMACRCPVVISNQVNIWREIQAERVGLVVGLDVQQIAAAIMQILHDPVSAAAMGVRGRETAARRYSWPPIVDQLTEVYRQAIAGNAVKHGLPLAGRRACDGCSDSAERHGLAER